MSVITRFWYGSLVVVMLVASLGLLIGNAVSQEREESQPIVVKDKAPRENPFASREGREREEREPGERPTERDILRQQVEVFKIALAGLLEAEKKDAAEVLQRAIRAREVMLEGRRDDEAHQIRERAPSRGQLAEILAMAAGVWREFNNREKAASVGRVAKEFANQPGERPRERIEPATNRPTERDVVKRRIEAMKTAMPALREGERGDAVELLERAIRGYEVGLEERRDEEAQRIRERMPSRGQLAEILTMASNLWLEFNNQDKAEVVGRLAGEFAGQGDREREGARSIRERREAEERERPRGESASAGRPAGGEVEHLKRTVDELHGQMNEMRRQMAEMQQMLKKLADRKDKDQ